MRTADIHWVRDEMVVPDAFDRIYSDEEIAAMNDGERCVARNEIIARSNGYSFKNGGLRDYFRARSWYHENPGADGGGGLSAGSIAYQNVERLRARTDPWWLDLATY
ncbi:MAG: YARHG domain-containing protein [Eggerthellaceae bacterium]|nr:YARHG domain-containing protein [Eggerthellaceae bacterium]